MAGKNSLSTMGGVKPNGKHVNRNDSINGDVRQPKNKGVSAQPGFVGCSADNDAAALTEDIVFETMLWEAEDKIRKRVKKGEDLEETTAEVINDMDMTFKEAEALRSRIKKAPPTTLLSPVLTSESSESRPESIYFKSPEEMNTATDILMYRKIPWASKGQDGDRCFVQFEKPEHMDEAHEALRRRWDFVENDCRKVAVIEFDNIDDYNKVLDFMQRRGMTLEFGGEHELDEDFNIEEENKKAQYRMMKKNKAMLPEDFAMNPMTRSFVAKRRGLEEMPIDTMKNSEHRMVKSRRKWK